jgi:hypothetical protein
MVVHHHHLHECFKSSFFVGCVWMRGSSPLSLSLLAIARVCDGSSPPNPQVFQIFFLRWMPVGTRFESSLFSIGYRTSFRFNYYHLQECFKSSFLVRWWWVQGSSPLSHFFVGYCTCVQWFITIIWTSVSNLRSRLMPAGTRFEFSLSLLC